jgi:hypothetical protein
MPPVIRTEFFQCERCRMECRIDSVELPEGAPLIIRHCPDGKDIPILGKLTRFQERRNGRWVDVQRDAA